MVKECPLCERRKEQRGEFCSFHNTALTNLKQAYKYWNEAYGGLEEEEYYSRLETHQDTGSAVKDVIKYLRIRGTTA